MHEKCGCCNGVGKVFMVRPTAGPTQIEDCWNCNGTGLIFQVGTFFITFKRVDELPRVTWRRPTGTA